MILTGAQILIETLIEQKTEVVFGYPGGSVLNIYDELYNNSHRIKHIISAHEQGAAHAADGYARASGKVGVVIATSGPGATNLVTGIANAYLDSVPLVAITGNVSCDLIGRDSFQEVDIVGITLPITKHNFIVKNVEELADTIREAFEISTTGRPGPVLIDIPKDVQINSAEFICKATVKADNTAKASYEQLKQAVEIISKSQRPYIYCGGGAVIGDASKEVTKLSELIDAPIGFSMMGLSAIPNNFENNLGMVGMHGHYASSVAKSEADLILALGVRFSDRATGNKQKYACSANIIHIDIDSAEIDKNISTTLGITSNLKTTLTDLIPMLEEAKKTDWQQRISELKEAENQIHPEVLGELTPFQVIDAINEATSPDTPIATDVGQHQMWTAQRYRFMKPRTFITSGGLGTMGFGMGAAIGACVATKKRTVLFTGDGSFGMNLNELATAVSQNLPLVIVVMNNGVLGMVRQWQTMFYQKHYSQTTLNRKTDFVKLAIAFGAEGYRAYDENSLAESIQKAFSSNGPVLIDCVINMDEKVLPMIPPGRSVEDVILR